MTTWILNWYLWIKAAHVVSVTAWMAGLFYLPRLFVYHVEATHPETRNTLAIMEYRLYRYIMKPAMHASLLFGILLLLVPGTLTQGWSHLKILCVLGLVVFQYTLGGYHSQLVEGTCVKSSRFFRIINEVPTLLLIIIIICVIVKPF
jgi:putative membrane protein